MNILFVNYIPFDPKLGGIERVTHVLARELIHKYNYKIYYLVTRTDLELNFTNTLSIKTFVLPSVDDVDKNKLFVKDLVYKYNINAIINQRGQSRILSEIINIQNVKRINVLHSQPSAFVQDYVIRKLTHLPVLRYEKIKFWIKKILFYPYFLFRLKREISIIISQQYHYLLANSDKIIMLSEKYKEDFRRCLSVNDRYARDIPIPLVDSKLVSIPNPNSFAEVNVEETEKEKILLYVGRLSAVDKNPLVLLKIWKRLFKKHLDWSLVIVGDGDAMPVIQKYIKKKKIKRVFLEGQQQDVLPYYKRAAFVCLTSNYEGWGMALTEGMQCKCVPVTFGSYSAAFDIIDDGVNGCIIKPNNINDYAKRLSELMSNDTMRLKMGKLAMDKAMKFDAKNVVTLWDQILKQ